MIKHIVFDIGNVLMTFMPEAYFIRWFQTEEKTHRICVRIFTHEAWEKYDQGIWMLEDLYEVYHAAYPDMVEETDIVLKNWLQLMEPMQESIAFLREVKSSGYGVYILSNISKDSADYLKETQEFFPLADGAVLSYEEKTNKPDPHIFEVLLQRYHLQSGEILYLDDNKHNIEQAARMGIHGILFTGEECLAEARALLKEGSYVKE